MLGILSHSSWEAFPDKTVAVEGMEDFGDVLGLSSSLLEALQGFWTKGLQGLGVPVLSWGWKEIPLAEHITELLSSCTL